LPREIPHRTDSPLAVDRVHSGVVLPFLHSAQFGRLLPQSGYRSDGHHWGERAKSV